MSLWGLTTPSLSATPSDNRCRHYRAYPVSRRKLATEETERHVSECGDMALFSYAGSSTTVKEIVLTPEPQQPRRWGVPERRGRRPVVSSWVVAV